MSRPNLLVLLTDQQRGETLDPSSPCETPNLDRLAARGVRFERCYGPNTVCSPARASLMTGELPHTHGMTHVAHTVPDHQARFQGELPTWSERLRDAGYRLGYVGKWHVERESGPGGFGFHVDRSYDSEAFAEGFARYRNERDLDDAYTFEGDVAGADAADEYRPADGDVDDRKLDLSYVVSDRGYADRFLYGTHDGPVEARRDHYAYERARRFVRDAADRGEPWCLVVSTFGPHDPFVVPPEYYERYDPAALDLPANFEDDLSDRPYVYGRMRSVWDGMDDRHFREALACYYAYCTYLDEQVGTLLDALDETGQREETAVAFTSDHGDQLGGHRLVLKGAPAFEESYRVPCVVSHPDGPDGAVCDDLLQTLDLAPTLVELADAEPLECYGRSAAPTVLGEQDGTDREVAFAEFFGQRYYWTHRVLWRGDEKLVFNPAGRDELYDLAADPGETENLADDPAHADARESMTRRLFREVRESGDDTLANTDYPTLRFAPVGPHAGE